mmetsp:Transcript_38209/g.69563  ORF Transcript_38209/g.69563 Transcript_38209/m.69563 type:complete len:474 (+) Transcript_38209:60-1481(+)
MLESGSHAAVVDDVIHSHPRQAGVHWLQAGLILFSFAAPSAVMAVPYAIGMAGFLGGSLICIALTSASIAGSMMLLAVKRRLADCHTFGDLGGAVLGTAGRFWGNAIQLGNFCLFLPCALQFTALALEGIGHGLPGLNGCIDYYVFVIALACLLTTQVRTLSNTQMLASLSVICVFAMAGIQVFAALRYDNPAKVPAQLFGNPTESALKSLVQACGGFTISSWAFVPAFLTVELADSMVGADVSASFRKSLLLAGGLNVSLFIIVGVVVVARWGYNVGEVVTLTKGVEGAWAPGSATNTAFNVFLLTGNFVSYMLDSVPLARFCQRQWAPNFKDTWSCADIFQYLVYTMPTFLFGLLLAVCVPSIRTLLDFTTAFTTPWVTQIYPAVLYWQMFGSSRGARVQLLDSVGASEQPEQAVPSTGKLTTREKIGVALVFCTGCTSFVICLAKACGYLAIPELRPPFRIGCGKWSIKV